MNAIANHGNREVASMAIRALSFAFLAGALGCATAPKAYNEPHPDDNAYVWKPLFDKTFSNAEFAAGAWHYDSPDVGMSGTTRRGRSTRPKRPRC